VRDLAVTYDRLGRLYDQTAESIGTERRWQYVGAKGRATAVLMLDLLHHVVDVDHEPPSAHELATATFRAAEALGYAPGDGNVDQIAGFHALAEALIAEVTA